MLKIIILLKKLIFKLLEIINGKVNRFDADNSKDLAKKFKKLKNLSKNGNLSKINIKKLDQAFYPQC